MCLYACLTLALVLKLLSRRLLLYFDCWMTTLGIFRQESFCLLPWCMADGEKKRFGNFAEYAKARQAGKIGGSDTFQISSQVLYAVL